MQKREEGRPAYAGTPPHRRWFLRHSDVAWGQPRGSLAGVVGEMKRGRGGLDIGGFGDLNRVLNDEVGIGVSSRPLLPFARV